MTETTFKEKFRFFCRLLFGCILFVTLLYSVVLVFTGYHNVDLAHNFMVMGERHDMVFEDMTLGGVTLTMREGYILGHQLIFVGFFILITMYIALSVIVLYAIFNTGGKEENGRTDKPSANRSK